MAKHKSIEQLSLDALQSIDQTLKALLANAQGAGVLQQQGKQARPKR